MVSTLIHDNGQQLARRGPHLDVADQRRRAPDPARQVPRRAVRAPLRRPDEGRRAQLRPDAVAAARKASGRSMVLLKNEGKLPFSKSKSTAVIGPLGDDQHDMLGPWWGRGEDKDVVTVFQGLKKQNPNTTFTAGCTVKNTEPPANTAVRRVR
jgi:beta-glucosidase